MTSILFCSLLFAYTAAAFGSAIQQEGAPNFDSYSTITFAYPSAMTIPPFLRASSHYLESSKEAPAQVIRIVHMYHICNGRANG